MTHTTEFFGPLLGVMCAANLDEAISFVHRTGFGLTAGLQSLDEREQECFLATVNAGNLYVNRGMTGAIVLRQPFGGMARSAIGPGLKTGGPNYITSLLRFKDKDRTSQALSLGKELASPISDLLHAIETDGKVGPIVSRQLRIAAASYAAAMREEFGCDHDTFRLVGQDNIRRYRPVLGLRIRASESDSEFENFARILAARTVSGRFTLSAAQGALGVRLEQLQRWTESWGGMIEFVEESDERLADLLRAGEADRVRFTARTRVPGVIWRAAAEAGVHLATAPVLSAGRIELLHYLIEQSISVDYHRYGNLGRRAEGT